MRVLSLLVMVVLLSGCASVGYRVDEASYRQRVRTLGVVPILVDEQLASGLPRSEEIRREVRDAVRGKAQRLVEMLREGKGYFDVRYVDRNPSRLFDSLVTGDSLQEISGEVRRHFGFSAASVGALAKQEAVDALLIVLFYDLEQKEKRWSRSGFDYLEANFISLYPSAQVVAPSGEILWRLPPSEPLMPLQYADFDHAYFNAQEEVRIVPISPEGIGRTLERAASEEEPNELPALLRGLFSRIRSALTPGLFGAVRL